MHIRANFLVLTVFLFTSVVLQHGIHGRFLKAYRNNEAPAPEIQEASSDIHEAHENLFDDDDNDNEDFPEPKIVEEENSERTIVEEKKTKKLYYAVRDSSESENYSDVEVQENHRDSYENPDINDVDFDSMSYSDRSSPKVLKDASRKAKYEPDFTDLSQLRTTTAAPYTTLRSLGARMFDSRPQQQRYHKRPLEPKDRTKKVKYDSDFSDLSSRRTTTTARPPYTVIRPHELRDHKVDTKEEQASQLYEMVRKPKKAFKPSALLQLMDTRESDDFYPSSFRTRDSSYSSFRTPKTYEVRAVNDNPPPPIVRNEIHLGGMNSDDGYGGGAEDGASPVIRNSIHFERYPKMADQSNYAPANPARNNYNQPAQPPYSSSRDCLQAQLLKALHDNNVLMQQQQRLPQPIVPIVVPNPAMQRLVPIPPRPRIPPPPQWQMPVFSPMMPPLSPVQIPMVNPMSFSQFPYSLRKRSSSDPPGKSTSQLATGSDKKPMNGRKRSKRSVFSGSERQDFPISFSIPILPSRSNVSVPSYAILDSELINVGDFDSNEDIFEKLERQFPPLDFTWMFHVPKEHVHSKTEAPITDPKPVEVAGSGTTKPGPPIENLVANIQQTSAAFSRVDEARKSPDDQSQEPPILFLIKPTSAGTKESEGRSSVPTALLVPAIQKHESNSTNGSYSFWFTSESGINFKENGFLKPIEAPAGSSQSKVANVKMGTISWTSPEGLVFTLTYEADERGYRPKITQHPSSPPTLQPPEQQSLPSRLHFSPSFTSSSTSSQRPEPEPSKT